MRTLVAICDIYELNMRNNEYTKDGKVLVRSNIALERRYIEEKNANWKTTGRFYDINEDKTDKYYGKKQVKVEEIEVEDAEEVIPEKSKYEGMLNGDLRVEYLEKFDKHVPPNMKNNNEWIIKKLEE